MIVHQTFQEAMAFNDRLTGKSDTPPHTGRATLFDDAGQEIKWLGPFQPINGPWNRLCLTTLKAWESGKVHDDGPTSEQEGPWVTLICEYPDGWLKDDLPPTFRRVADARIPK